MRAWRVFWVRAAGPRSGSDELRAWSERLAEREAESGARPGDAIFLAPDYRVDPLLTRYVQSRTFRSHAVSTRLNYATDIALFLTHHQSGSPHMSPAPDERDRIRAAMQRILTGTPEYSNGALTIVALSIEAQVPRNALTQRHPDLRNEFYAHVRERGAVPDAEARLRSTIVRLKETIANRNEELGRLREDVPALVRALSQLTAENEALRQQLQLPTLNVIPLRPKPRS